MKNCKNKLVFVILALLSLFACDFYETKLQIDLPAPKPKLVVHSIFKPFTLPMVKSFTVSLSQSTGMFDTIKTCPVTDATVSLFVNGKFDQIMKPGVNGYFSKDYPQTGVEYSIEVEKEGFEPVTAKGTIPEKVLIKETRLIPFAALDELKNPLSQLSVTFNDPIEQ